VGELLLIWAVLEVWELGVWEWGCDGVGEYGCVGVMVFGTKFFV